VTPTDQRAPYRGRPVRLTLGRLSAAFELGVRDRKVTHNPVRYVELPKQVKRDLDTWSAAQVRAFLTATADDRLHAAWRLTLYGLRRAEVCGLRWSDVDLAAGTITIAHTRPVVEGKVIVKAPKSQRGTRTLPTDAELIAALEALHDRQVTEAMEAGEAYAASGYVVTDELGAPVHPDWYSDEFHRLRESAGIDRITLRNSRATANTLMADAGVPDHIRAAWCGHTVAVNVASYTAVRPESLSAALGALSAAHNPCDLL
jgi:integrase